MQNVSEQIKIMSEKIFGTVTNTVKKHEREFYNLCNLLIRVRKKPLY